MSELQITATPGRIDKWGNARIWISIISINGESGAGVIVPQKQQAAVVAAINSYAPLLEACQAWMLVESEMGENNPSPDLILRSDYRRRAIALTKAALAAASGTEGA